ncbi:MAG: glycosyl hydrolase [Ignavibacteriae bacterium]|nr:MAG: glycosyl hydrolase [Ignavibacteriota bacterium]
MLKKFLLLLLSLFISSSILIAQDNDEEKKEDKSPYSSSTFNGLKFRLLGPAITSGRVSDFAVNPNNYHEFYAAVASGNVWKTTNSGTTWEPIFDSYGSYSIGCATLDPNNPHVVYVGTGENNSQRSVSWGDGIYRSEDGGKSFENIGLIKSEHIAKILVDPRDSKIIYVAAQGPLWKSGGQRGLYKSTDYGATWDSVLYISENTGVTDVVMDPRNPDVLYAASYQRRRHVWVLLNGGPESAIYKSTDAGTTWNKIKSGLPKGDIGRIGLAISPVNPDHVFAIIEAREKGGFYKSTNRGASWKKTNDYKTASAQYYNEIFCDPKDVNKIYSLDTRTKVSIDGGITFNNLGNKARHVDDHALWINPENTDHFLIGGDGGIYETFDNAKTWQFKGNLPITQFYRVSVDNAEPFYWVYGGTQDNNSMGVPSQTINNEGIVNADWIPTLGGDGYETQVDPVDPNIVYAQYQYGGLVRYDKKSGEYISIKPQEGKDDEPLIWNWDSPLLLSPHKHTRLYFAANKLFRSDDRGNSWVAISDDLTRQIDRNKLKVMNKVWSVDAVAKNASTSFYGNIVSLTESPLIEGLIYIGTDDGLIQVTEDGGENWRKIEKFTGVPEMTYVSCLYASLHDPNTVYAAFDNHKQGDFKPYILKSNDRGKSWRSISGDLEDPFVIYSVIQDHINPELLFAGTEYGIFFSINEGKKWIQLKGSLPTIAVRDIDIQRRENDLVLGTFGRGFYVLDNYSPLRGITEKNLNEEENILFPVKDALMFVKRRGTFGGVGTSFFKAENPPFGATFNYFIKESPKTRKAQRQEEEKELLKDNKPIYYPSWDELRLEDREEKSFLLFTISDENGNVVRKLKEGIKSGINRITWDLRYANTNPVKKVTDKNESGSPVMPGKFSVEMFMSVDGELTKIAGPQTFEAKVLQNSTLPAEDRAELVAFQREFWEFNRAVEGALNATRDLKEKTDLLIYAIKQTPDAPNSLMDDALKIKKETDDILKQLYRDEAIANRNEPTYLSIYDRLNEIAWGVWRTTSSPTQTQRDSYKAASEEFEPLLAKVKQLIEVDLKNLESDMEKYSAPWTPGRVPGWNKE